MRRLYLDLLRARLRRGDFAFPLRAARTLWGVRRGEAKPLLGTLVATYRCDLACEFCDLPRRGDRRAELGTEEMKGVLSAFRDLGVLGVGITVTVLYYRSMKGSKLRDWFELDHLICYFVLGGVYLVGGVWALARVMAWLLGEK